MVRAACLLVLLALAAPLGAEEVEDPVVAAAIEKGVKDLEGCQDPTDGAFRGEWFGQDYRSGETALALLTLLKAGVPPNAPSINQGFDWLLAQSHKRVYSVSVAILALEARFTPPPEKSIKDDEPLKSQIRKRFQKGANGPIRKWLTSAVAFLEKHQGTSGYWKYPFFGEEDLSNTQFAILALKAAERMGAKVDPQVYLRSVEILLRCQEAAGPEVAAVPVPAAERAIAGLLDRRAKLKKARKRRGFRRTSKRASAKRRKQKEKEGTRTRDPKPEEVETRTRMKARGWGYKPGDGPRGSMTAAGLAVLVVCKSALEGNGRYDEVLGPQVDLALRDGAAWMADRFRVDRNPGAESDWLFYYLYTLERAGTLLALNRFGARDWYEEGAEVILGAQQADGRFHASTGGQLDGDLVATCFAILFLERSTVPIIKRPKTGGDAHYGVPQGTTTRGPLVEVKGDGTLSVTFTFREASGHTVTVAGSFNGWSKSANPLRDTGSGTYTATIDVPAGRHTYKFVVDGKTWRDDPANPKSEPDGHGGKNSVIER
jgi:hypothetical protein